MLFGKVIGTVTPSTVYKGLESIPLLLIQPLDKKQKPIDFPIVAADCTRMAGREELIYYESSREAALALDPWFVPVDHAIIGIVDGVNLFEQVNP